MNTRARGRNKPKTDNPDLATASRLLQDVTKKITRLESQLKELHQQREEYARQVESLQAADAPIKRLPVEILCNIFEHVAAPEVLDKGSMREAEVDRTCLLLACKAWRDIAIDTPSLWSFILVTSPPYHLIIENVEWVRKRLLQLQLCIARSKALLLDVVLEFDAMSHCTDLLVDSVEKQAIGLVPEDELDAWMEFGTRGYWLESPVTKYYHELCFDLVSVVVGEGGGHMKRWRSLTFCVPEMSSDLLQIWSRLIYPAPSLRSLLLDGTMDGLFDPLTDYYDVPFFSSVPRMEIGSEFNFMLDGEYPNVRHLKIWYSPTQMMTLRDHFPELEELTIEGTPFDIITPPPRPIQMPRVQNLVLNSPIPLSAIKALQFDALPRLSLVDVDEPELFQCWTDLITQAPLFGIAQQLTLWRCDDDGSFNEAELKKVLAILLPQLENAELIAVPKSMMAVVRKSSVKYKGKGMLSSLRAITTVDESGGIDYAGYPV